MAQHCKQKQNKLSSQSLPKKQQQMLKNKIKNSNTLQ